MSTSLPRRFRRVVAATAATALTAGTLALVATPAQAATTPVAGAVFAWGLSNEVNNAGFAPGTANFLSAGKIANPGAGGNTLTSATAWSNGKAANWTARAGNVEIQKKTVAGGYATATWEGLKTSPSGASISPPTSNIFSDHRVAIKGGTGTADVAADDATITWTGDFTVLGYSGMTFFYVSDPKLSVDDGVGTVTATLDGYGTTQDDTTIWTDLESKEVTLATVAGVDVTPAGITVTPDFAGVEYESTDVPQNRTTTGWGAWPSSFVKFVEPTGQAAYWYFTGGAVDRNKTPLPLTVSFPGPAKVTVSSTTIPDTGAHQVTVKGSGFDPSLATGTRPPLAGKPTGAYVILGTVADVWRPSEGAPSTTRKAITQKWAVLAEDMATIGGPASGAIELKPDGTFTTSFSISKAAIDASKDKLANLGIYTYAGGGPQQALYETFTPISFFSAVASTTTLSAPAKVTYGRTGTATATVKASKALSGSIQLLDGTKVIGTRPVGAGTASFALPKNLTVGTHRLSARFVSGNAPVVKSSSSAARTLSIAKVTTKTAVKVTKKPTRKKAGKATVTVSGTPKAKGKVTLVIKGKGIKKTVRGTVKNGKVVVKLPKLKKKGTYKVTATFAATGTHKGSKKTVKVKVTK